MIGIVGHMSGGKTLTAVTDLLQRLKTGHVVATNIRLNCRGVSAFLNAPCVQWKRNYYYLSEEETGYNVLGIADYHTWPMGSPRGSSDYDSRLVYIYLDEVSSLFDSITHSSQENIKEVAVWARHTLKRGQVVYLIMQFSSELHKRLRNHITEYWSMVNTTNLRIPVLNFRLPRFLRGYIIRTKYAGDEETLVENPKWHLIDKRVYSCYNTGQIVFGGSIGVSTYAADLDMSFGRFRQALGVIWLLLILNLLAALSASFILWRFSA